MFEWAPGIPIMYDMTDNEDKESNKENKKIELIEDIVENFIIIYYYKH